MSQAQHTLDSDDVVKESLRKYKYKTYKMNEKWIFTMWYHKRPLGATRDRGGVIVELTWMLKMVASSLSCPNSKNPLLLLSVGKK